MRPLLLALLLPLAPPASALERDLDGSGLAFSCRPYYKDPPVAVPSARDQKGAVDPRMTRILRASLLKGARALRKLELQSAKAACPRYAGGEAIREDYERLVSSASAELRRGVEQWDEVNLGWTVSWSELPLSALEKEAGEALLKDGPFAATCTPPEVSEELFVPAAGQAAGEEERKALALLAEQAATLRESLRENRAAVAELLRALEGRSCAELGRRYYSMALRQRAAYFEHRDQTLGKLYRDKLKWEPLAAAAP
jgi:hypothetical protein